MSLPLVVNFHTPGPYEAEAAEMIASARAHGLEVDAEMLPAQGKWGLNACLKGPFVLRKLREHSRPILWLDADARVHAKPVLFDDPPFEMAMYRMFTKPINSVIYLRPTSRVLSVVEEWAAFCESPPSRMPFAADQTLLSHVLHTRNGKTPVLSDLPQCYCKIVGRRWKEGQKRRMVIEQTQASRRLAGVMGGRR
jgi:hypothetical protein